MEMRSLPVVLNDEEYKVRADQLAQRVKDLRMVEVEKKCANDSFKSRIESCTSEINSLSTIVKEHKEYRPVECQWVENLERYTMDLIRSDSGEAVDARPMTHEERQPRLFPVAETRGKKDKAAAIAEDAG